MAIAVLVYEYSLTIHDEVSLYWGRRLTGARLLFFVMKYLTLAANLALFVQSADFSSPKVNSPILLCLVPDADLHRCRPYTSHGFRTFYAYLFSVLAVTQVVSVLRFFLYVLWAGSLFPSQVSNHILNVTI